MLGRTVVIAAALFAFAPSASAQENTAFAQRRYSAGLRDFDAGRYASALTAFQASLALYTSPNTLLYVARTLARLQRRVEAVEAYERTIGHARERAASDPRYANALEAAQNEMQPLESQIARLTVTVDRMPAGAILRVGARDVPAEALGIPIAVDPGAIEIALTAAGQTLARQSETIAAGESRTIQLHLGSEAGPPRTDSTTTGSTALVPIAWTAVGVGVVAFVGAGIFAALASTRYNDLDTRCVMNPGCSDSEFASIVASGRALQFWTNLSLGVGAAGLATGIALHLLHWHSSSRTPHVALTPSGVVVFGAF